MTSVLPESAKLSGTLLSLIDLSTPLVDHDNRRTARRRRDNPQYPRPDIQAKP